MNNPMLEVKLSDVSRDSRKVRVEKARALVQKTATRSQAKVSEARADSLRLSASERASREDASYAILGLYSPGVVLGLSKRDARRLARYGVHIAETESYEAAKDYALLAVAADDSYVPACLLMGACLAREGKDREALSWYERAKTLAPKDVRAYVDCGELKLGLGDYLGAAADFETALKLDPDGKLAATRRAMSLVARTMMSLS